MANKFVVLGGGPGGYVAALRAANLGLDVTLIEKEHLGGTCLNWGCIPTKTYFHSAKVLKEARKSPEILGAGGLKIDFRKLTEKQDSVVKQLITGITSLLRAAGVDVVKGRGTLTENGVLIDDNKNVSYDNLLIATGASPLLIYGIEPDGKRVFTAKEIWKLDELPESMVILGGGVIGVEFATIFSTFGTKVTIVEREESILPQLTKGASRQVARRLRNSGVEIKTGTSVTGYNKKDNTLLTKKETIGGDVLLVALGNRANTADLGLERLDVKLNRSGEIVVDADFMTSNSHIYAVGDVTDSAYKLAHAASYAGIYVAEKLAGLDPFYKEELIPRTVFTDPEIGEVGVLEGKKSRFPFSGNGRALSSGVNDGFIEAYGSDEKLNGVVIVGPEACELGNLASYSLAVGGKKEDLKKAFMTHPTLGEAFQEAGLGLFGEAVHMIKR